MIEIYYVGTKELLYTGNNENDNRLDVGDKINISNQWYKVVSVDKTSFMNNKKTIQVEPADS